MAGKRYEEPYFHRMVLEVRFKTEDDARNLVRALRGALRSEKDPRTRSRLKTMSMSIVYETSNPRQYRPRVSRPREDDEFDLAQVIDGIGPYPVLSLRDARRAFVALQSSLSLIEMAERLHMDPRSASRWAKAYKEGKWNAQL